MSGEYYGYDGPCPPWNDALVHHYVFTVYALASAALEVTGPLTGASVRAALEVAPGLGQARLTGLYRLNRPRCSSLSSAITRVCCPTRSAASSIRLPR